MKAYFFLTKGEPAGGDHQPKVGRLTAAARVRTCGLRDQAVSGLQGGNLEWLAAIGKSTGNSFSPLA